MELLAQQVVAGIATGAIYGLMALALVMIFRAIGHVNFAQGEMATLSTFGAWQLMEWGVPYWLAFATTAIASFAGGYGMGAVVFRPLHRAPALTQIAAFVALLLILNSLSGFVWGHTLKSFPAPFGSGPLFGALIGRQQAAMIGVAALLVCALLAFFLWTKTGMAMRAAALDPDLAALAGIDVGRMTAIGWGMSAVVGAVAGMLVAPVLFLEPNMMQGVLVYGFAAAVIGGLRNPVGAVLGAFVVGVVENLAGTFVPVIGGELKLPLALAVIIAVLALRRADVMAVGGAHRA